MNKVNNMIEKLKCIDRDNELQYDMALKEHAMSNYYYHMRKEQLSLNNSEWETIKDINEHLTVIHPRLIYFQGWNSIHRFPTKYRYEIHYILDLNRTAHLATLTRGGVRREQGWRMLQQVRDSGYSSFGLDEMNEFIDILETIERKILRTEEVREWS
ncbi:hypothetical protein SAMN05421767_10640 [Granulicatella balaenopterae]|uniref:Uncharacterized protein n=1 Tax=Granulicatella balaenopterae TaxID=137733 RepID=A0A1H9INJ0_9LACT|nr:hypothetical protein [Granulicatella balaenopterae]SEQ76089.1 hypothetical protein SAMN05421767_10640 [Granulicatella balaenopterae]